MKDPLSMREIPDYTLTIPVSDYQILIMAQIQLNDIRQIIAADPKPYGNLNKVTENAVEILLGIERKEKAD